MEYTKEQALEIVDATESVKVLRSYRGALVNNNALPPSRELIPTYMELYNRYLSLIERYPDFFSEEVLEFRELRGELERRANEWVTEKEKGQEKELVDKGEKGIEQLQART